MREISAGIIIYRRATARLDDYSRPAAHEPKFLIVYHGKSYWNFPKGRVESEEKSWQAAVREIREETGLRLRDLKFKRQFKAYEKFVFYRQKEKIFKIVIFYLAEARKSEVRLSHEHEGYGWFTYKEAMKILSKFKDSQRVLAQANDFIHQDRRHA